MVRLKKDGSMLDEIIPLASAQAQNEPGENGAQYQVDFIRRGEALEFEAVTIVR